MNIFDIPLDMWENHISHQAQAKLRQTCRHLSEIRHSYREANKDTIKDLIRENN